MLTKHIETVLTLCFSHKSMFKVLFLSASLFLVIFLGAAQVPNADFDLPTTACLSQSFKLTNQSANATNYTWDFCDGDLKEVPTASLLTNSYGGYGTRTEVEEHNGEFFGFFLSGGTQNLYRLDFGNSLNNKPTLTSLGNLGLNSNQLRAVTIVKDGSSYFGFIVDGQKNTLYRLDFGTSLLNAPQSPVAIFQGAPLNSPFQLTTVSEGIIKYLFVTNNGDGNLIRMKFTTGYSSTISEAYSIAASPQWLNSISFINENGIWHAACVSFLLGQILKIDFVNGLSDNSPVITFINSNTPISAELVSENGQYYIFSQSRNAQLSLIKISFGSSLSNTPTVTEMPNVGFGSSEIWNLSLFNSKSTWVGFAVEQIGQNIYKIQFPNNCFATTEYSTDFQPIVSTINPGIFSVSLSAKDASGNTANLTKSITVKTDKSPDINFTTQNNCINNNVNFTTQNTSGNIADYAWDFGDTNISAVPNPFHAYTAAKAYPAALTVTATNGCRNFVEKTLNIYPKPIADFSLPIASPFCTNQNYAFTNQSAFDANSNPTWEWRLNGILVSSTKDLRQSFTSATSQEIRLKALIPGCENEAVKNVSTVLPGPFPDFTFANGCQASSVPFTNMTTGSVTFYSWIFGDGNTSSLPNASNTYISPGPYTVTLQANNAVGCQNSVTKPITIYSKPQPDFSISLPPFSCSGTPSQFTNLTPNPTDSNIASQSWSFGDITNGTSDSKNPTYIYETANNFNVKLSVATNFGCTNSIQKSVTIAQSPIATFTNQAACLGQPTQFTDASTGSIKSRLWQMQTATFMSPNPQYTFPMVGSFPITLTVTGNNSCIGQFKKDITISPAPSLDFSVQSPCDNSPTLFTEITSTLDPSTSQSWAFGSIGNKSGNPVEYSFPSPANYAVRLSSTRQSGCVYSVSKIVSIVNAPIADFTPSVESGAAPLGVSFANNSTYATSYIWKFGDANNTTSVNPSPSFVFSDEGDYKVELKASNNAGCSNQTSKVISVVLPRIDAVLEDFFFVKDPNSTALQAVVRVLNKGNVTLKDPTILIDVTGGSLIKKKISGTLKPNQQITQSIDYQIIPRSINYVCAEVEVLGDVDLFLNRRCVSLTGEEFFFTPYPNPAKAELNLDWISSEASPVTVMITNSTGSIMLEETFATINLGLNRLLINTNELASGIYFVRLNDNRTTKSFTFVAQGN
jgi:PKD repeat protein